MRKIYAKILQGLCLSGVLLTASCQKDQNVFSTTPAERTSQSLQEALTTLQSSVYGWKIRSMVVIRSSFNLIKMVHSHLQMSCKLKMMLFPDHFMR